jgi:predicted nucleic acid-binding protein
VSFLLDTNVISEWIKPEPNAGVVAWLAEIDEDRVLISVISLAELRRGVDGMDQGARRKRLDTWLRHDLPVRFEGRVLGIDMAVADAWGAVVARQEARGRPIAPMDAFIAATAEVYALTLVTRNVADFATSVERVVDPWTSRL